MKQRLEDLLLDYIRENNPALLEQLLADDALHVWVLEKLKEVDLVLTESKPFKVLEKECMESMTADLRPARIRYIRDLLEERFTAEYEDLLATGLLTYELVSMTAYCQDLFEAYPLQEGIDQPALDQQVVRKLSAYLLNQYQVL